MPALTSISPVAIKDFQLLTDLGKQSFLESHGNSGPEKDIHEYVQDKYSPEVVKQELSDPKNIYHIIYYKTQPAGYSKIALNVPHQNIPAKNVTKLERIYLLKEFYGQQLGAKLMQFNINLSRENKQSGMWLFVWTENKRAVDFYTGFGFSIIGKYDFPLSKTHSNPNHQLFLSY